MRTSIDKLFTATAIAVMACAFPTASGSSENCVNCWKPLRAFATTAQLVTADATVENAKDWAISSQAAEGSVEGSTTRVWSPERTVKPQERATRKGRYSLFCDESRRGVGLNADAVTVKGYMYSDQLSEVLRTALQPTVRYRQFSDIQEGKGLSTGAKLYWDVYSDVVTPGAPLNEQNTMPETNFTVAQENLTVREYGNSVPFTMLLDDLSKHSVTQVINKVLRHDARKTLDGAAHTQFAATKLTVTPATVGSGATGTSTTSVVLETTGTPSLQNDVALGTGHVRAINDLMKERNIPAFDGEHYMCIARPATLRNLKNELEGVYKYVDQGFGLIYNGEIGKYDGTRFVEQTAVASSGWAAGKSDTAYFFGSDTVAEGIVIPEEVRGKIPGDYGRSKGVAWFYLGGFGICHTVAADSRILKWASAS